MAAWLLILSGPARAAEWRTFVSDPPAPRPVAAVAEVAPPVVVPEVLPEEPEPIVVAAAAPVIPAAETRPAETQLVAAAEPDPQGPCAEDAKECREALQRLRADALAGIDLDIRVGGRAGGD